MSKPICIYHGNCADGFGAAWVVRKALGGEVDFHAGVYGQQPPTVANRDVIMVDFSYRRPVLMGMAAGANSVLILDHHKTAAEDLAGFPPSVEIPGEKIAAVFDMERSGAGLTWDHFFPNTPRPALIDHIEDRDLWRFALPRTRDIQANLFSFPYNFDVWDDLIERTSDLRQNLSDFADEGAAIERKHHKDVAELVAAFSRTMIIGGYAVPVANIPYTLTSDAGNLMAQRERFAACYWDTPNGRVFSLRSTEDGMDVSTIAKAYGGGGHAHASGFTMPLGWEGDR